MSESDLVICCVPSLVATLLFAEREKGSPLDEAEVLQIRDSAPAIAMPQFAVAEIEKERGYRDIDQENCWAEWQAVRLSLQGETPDYNT
ncbi:hypothetical protein ACETRX_30130 [Labrys portucalensis]|uniref:Uncharacterized protein n=1 Tax=Labrys neptuniae TaxID=376174 RepID=A0ABV6ZP65_9HYPH